MPRKRRGENRRGLTEPKPAGAGGQRHTETDGVKQTAPSVFQEGEVTASAAKGTDRHGGTGSNR